jgi:hypothetical protein
MRLKLLFAGALIASASFAPVSAGAFTLYDNIGALSNGADSALESGPLYDSFSTGATALTISQFDLLLVGTSGSKGTFQVQILTDAGTTPSGVVYSSGPFSDSILSGVPTDVSFSFAPQSLLANTRYWIGLIGDSNSSVMWSYSMDVSGPGVAGESFANQMGVFPASDGPYQMLVTGNVATTPLPAALPLFASGLGALGLVSWRRKRKARAA